MIIVYTHYFAAGNQNTRETDCSGTELSSSLSILPLLNGGQSVYLFEWNKT